MNGAEETRPSVMRRKDRNDALINGALIALGALAIFDNVVGHWVLELHRVIPGEQAFNVEVTLIALGVILLVVGLWRELRARGVSFHR